jgi:2-hydroxychromene-2-carboxylate isomerase
MKATFPQEVFEKAWQQLLKVMWTPPWSNITVAEVLHEELTKLKLFSAEEVDETVAAAESQEWKDKLLANTQKALDQGAFGAPWFWVRNAAGKEEPFFGSDRYVCDGR